MNSLPLQNPEEPTRPGDTTGPPLIHWGRCRHGERWFWAAQIIGGGTRYGFASSRGEASRKANAAAVLLSGGQYATIRINDQVAETKLAAVTAERQAKARQQSKQRAAAGDDTANLWAIEYGYYDHVLRQWIHSKLVRLPIIKRTTKRIYFLRSSEPGEYETGYVDRQRIETDGWAYYHRFTKIYAQPPELPDDKPFIPPPFHPEYAQTVTYTAADLKRLKAEMADAHPDRGGTDEAFIAARQRYVAAKRMAGVR